MIIRETYVKDSEIARMAFVADHERHRYQQGKLITEVTSYADILTVSGSQVQIVCEKEDFMAALRYLKDYHPDFEEKERKHEIFAF
jgi:hypothetical protein